MSASSSRCHRHDLHLDHHRRIPPAGERTGRTRWTEPLTFKGRALARGGIDGVARLTKRPAFQIASVSRRAVIGGLKP
ncbi:hypothetical protein [Brevundimonas sp. DWR2-3-1b1]|uniref:hypothetical protein n=1 Tax=unclassified Brevundimonas TaxID=2622653 RepID=UPI003CF5D21D